MPEAFKFVYIKYHGVWDADELYDLEKDGKEMHNRLAVRKPVGVIPDKEFAQTYARLHRQLAELIIDTGSTLLPVWKK